MRNRDGVLLNLRRQFGMTLVELLVVIGVVAIMVAIVLSVLHKAIQVVQSFR